MPRRMLTKRGKMRTRSWPTPEAGPRKVVKEAQANADELKDQAQQRYQDVVGSLADQA